VIPRTSIQSTYEHSPEASFHSRRICFHTPASSNVIHKNYKDNNFLPLKLTSCHSTIRQVPDNQEVYLDTDGFTSLTFDITERVSHLSNDREALEYHLADIIADEDTKEVLFADDNIRLPKFS